MKLETPAGALADALAMAELATAADANTRKIASLGAVHITVAGNEAVSLSVNALDRYVGTSCPASISHPGEVAVAVDRLAALAAGFARDATVKLTSDDNALTVRCGRSNYKLPALPLEDLPATPCIGDAPLGQVELDHERALCIFERPLFSVSAERTRSYLNGIFLHSLNDELLAVGTDGARLARTAIPAAGCLSSDRRLIVPLASIKPLIKLLKKSGSPVILSRSRTLFEVRTEKFSFISKLIDGEFPAYESLIPPARLPNTATVERDVLLRALARLKAVSEDRSAVGLVWDAGATALRLPLLRERDVVGAEDVAGEFTGSARVAVSLSQLHEICEEFANNKTLLLECNGLGAIRITSPDDDGMLVLQMPLRWAIDEIDAEAA
jgi:DNA polymerase III subunit beta